MPRVTRNGNVLRPFHESIIEAIDRAQTPKEFQILAYLLKKTDIRKNHNSIASTWRGCSLEVLDEDDFSDVAKSVLAQKPDENITDEELYSELTPKPTPYR